MKVGKVRLAATLLEIEALVMDCRAQALLQNREAFMAALLESRARLGGLTTELLRNQCAALDDLFPTADESSPAVGAVDPQVRSTGTPPTRAASCALDPSS